MALQLIKPVLDGEAKSIQVTEEATEDYNAWLLGRLSKSVWTECNSYYQIDGRKQSKIIGTFPLAGPVTLFWWLTRTFHGVAAEAWEKQRGQNTMKKWSCLAVFPMVVALFHDRLPRSFERLSREL